MKSSKVTDDSRGRGSLRLCLKLALAGVWLLAGVPSDTSAAERPNVLFIFTDDQRHDTIRALGNTHIQTPNMDRLVKAGTTFTRAYIMGASSAAVCAPSRACMMTGLSLWNLENKGAWSFNISDKYVALPEVFKKAGYVSFGTGKQHNGKGVYARSFSSGESIFFGGMTSSQYAIPLCSYGDDGAFSPTVQRKGTHSAEVYATATIDFLKSQKESSTPFFIYLAFQTPHDPRQSPKEVRAMYKDEDLPLPVSFMPKHPFDNGMLKIRDEGLARTPRTERDVRKHLGDYYAMITHTDAQIGRVLEALEATGRKDNTIIVFASDNGLSMGRHGLLGKQSVYDHAVHVPLVIGGPGIPKDVVRKQQVYIYDLYPTLCEMAGLEVPDSVEFQSLTPLIKHADAKGRDHLYFAFMNWQRSVQDDRFKLIEYCVKGARTTQLFDLGKDPHELTNLASDPEQAPTLARLRKTLEADRVRLSDGKTSSGFTTKQGVEFWATYDAN